MYVHNMGATMLTLDTIIYKSLNIDFALSTSKPHIATTIRSSSSRDRNNDHSQEDPPAGERPVRESPSIPISATTNALSNAKAIMNLICVDRLVPSMTTTRPTTCFMERYMLFTGAMR